MALDGARRRLYVADSGNHRVLRWNVTSLIDGMSAESVLGRPDLTSASAALGATGMNDPRGLTIVPGTTTTLLVTERGNHRLTVFDLP